MIATLDQPVMAPAAIPSTKAQKSKAELLAHVSASRLSTFHQCRLKFYFRYVLGLSKPRPLALHLGSAVHYALQQWNRSRWKNEPLPLEKLKTMYESFWAEEQKFNTLDLEGEDEGKEREAGWALVQVYLSQTPIQQHEKPEAVEVTVEADLRKHGLTKLVGIIDLIRAGRKIVDFKTCGSTPNAEKSMHIHEAQLSCYAVLYRDATGSRETGFELHQLVKLKQPKLVVSEIGPMLEYQQVKLFKVIESYLNGIAAEDWVPAPNVMSCACCEFFHECRQWRG